MVTCPNSNCEATSVSIFGRTVGRERYYRCSACLWSWVARLDDEGD